MSKLLEIALSQYGQKEVVGKLHNDTILNYAKEAGFTWVSDDETPWCSIFLNWATKKAGVSYSGKANARSWLNVGIPVTTPTVGDVVVLSRGSNPASGHVGIYIANCEDEQIWVLGGNQSNRVSITTFPKSDILGFRRLHEN